MTAAGSTACTAQHSSIPTFAAVDPSSFLNTSMVPTLNMPMGMSAPTAAATTECTTLAGAVSQSAQYLVQHSLSGSLPSQTAAEATAAVFGPSSCPELPQVRTTSASSCGKGWRASPSCRVLFDRMQAVQDRPAPPGSQGCMTPCLRCYGRSTGFVDCQCIVP
jgi:hypothetical protein